MVRFVAIGVAISAVLAAPALARAAVPPPTPPCPQVEGWGFSRTYLIDNGLGVDFSCEYAKAGIAEQLTLNVVWTIPAARDTDVDYTQCRRAAIVGPAHRLNFSRSHIAREDHTVSGGVNNAAVFQADRERIEKAALVLLTATEKLAKSCTKSTPAAPAKDVRRPSVRVQPAKGARGTAITFPFSFSDNSGRAGLVLKIYDGRAKAKLLFRKSYGSAKSGTYSVKIRVQKADTHLWCLTGTDAAGNAATACSSLVVR